jgi:hypothetical protein
MTFDPTRNVSFTAQLNLFSCAQIEPGRHRDAGEAAQANLRLLQRPEWRNQCKGAALSPEQARG